MDIPLGSSFIRLQSKDVNVHFQFHIEKRSPGDYCFLEYEVNVTEKAEYSRVYRGEFTPFICLDLRNFDLETVGYREYSSDRRQVGLLPWSKHKELEQVVCFGNVAIPDMRTPKRPRISSTPTTAGSVRSDRIEQLLSQCEDMVSELLKKAKK